MTPIYRMAMYAENIQKRPGMMQIQKIGYLQIGDMRMVVLHLRGFGYYICALSTADAVFVSRAATSSPHNPSL